MDPSVARMANTNRFLPARGARSSNCWWIVLGTGPARGAVTGDIEGGMSISRRNGSRAAASFSGDLRKLDLTGERYAGPSGLGEIQHVIPGPLARAILFRAFQA